MAGSGGLFGYEIESEFPLRRLAPGISTRGALRLLRARAPISDDGGSLVYSVEIGGSLFTLTRVGTRLVARCSLTGSFLIDGAAGTVWADAALGTNDRWEHRVVSTAIPLLLAERGDLVAHAAAVASNRGAVLFAGATGRGKSTLAWTAGSLGYRVLSEDGAVITLAGEEATVWPGPVGVRFSQEAGSSSKATRFLPRDAHAAGPVPLAAVVILRPRTRRDFRLEAVRPPQAVPAIVPSLVFGGPDRLRQAFALAARLATLVPVYRCSLKDEVAAAGSAVVRILNEVADSPSHDPPLG